jgi:hypothetical protein
MVVFGSAWPSLSCLTLIEARKESSRVYCRAECDCVEHPDPKVRLAMVPMRRIWKRLWEEHDLVVDETLVTEYGEALRLLQEVGYFERYDVTPFQIPESWLEKRVVLKRRSVERSRLKVNIERILRAW